MDVMEMVEREQFRTDLPDFRVGDTVKVHVKIVEGDKCGPGKSETGQTLLFAKPERQSCTDSGRKTA